MEKIQNFKKLKFFMTDLLLFIAMIRYASGTNIVCMDLSLCNLLKGDLSRESSVLKSETNKFYKLAEDSLNSNKTFCESGLEKCIDDITTMAVDILQFPKKYKNYCNYKTYSRILFACKNRMNWPKSVVNQLPKEYTNCRTDCIIDEDQPYNLSNGKILQDYKFPFQQVNTDDVRFSTTRARRIGKTRNVTQTITAFDDEEDGLTWTSIDSCPTNTWGNFIYGMHYANQVMHNIMVYCSRLDNENKHIGIIQTANGKWKQNDGLTTSLHDCATKLIPLRGIKVKRTIVSGKTILHKEAIRLCKDKPTVPGPGLLDCPNSAAICTIQAKNIEYSSGLFIKNVRIGCCDITVQLPSTTSTTPPTSTATSTTSAKLPTSTTTATSTTTSAKLPTSTTSRTPPTSTVTSTTPSTAPPTSTATSTTPPTSTASTMPPTSTATSRTSTNPPTSTATSRTSTTPPTSTATSTTSSTTPVTPTATSTTPPTSNVTSTTSTKLPTSTTSTAPSTLTTSTVTSTTSTVTSTTLTPLTTTVTPATPLTRTATSTTLTTHPTSTATSTRPPTSTTSTTVPTSTTTILSIPGENSTLVNIYELQKRERYFWDQVIFDHITRYNRYYAPYTVIDETEWITTNCPTGTYVNAIRITNPNSEYFVWKRIMELTFRCGGSQGGHSAELNIYSRLRNKHKLEESNLNKSFECVNGHYTFLQFEYYTEKKRSELVHGWGIRMECSINGKTEEHNYAFNSSSAMNVLSETVIKTAKDDCGARNAICGFSARLADERIGCFEGFLLKTICCKI